jgi:adenylate cyclase, class 2
MAHETEIKLRVADLRAFRGRLKKLGARTVGQRTGRVHEWNVLFDTAAGDLRQRGQLLRIRTETTPGANRRPRANPGAANKRVVVTFKRPIDGDPVWDEREGTQRRHKVREELEVEVADAESQAKIFEGLGMRGWFRYEKFRTTFRFPKSRQWAAKLLVELDETPIGVFAELEGPAQAIDQVAKALGYAHSDYIVMSYLSLYRAECQRRGEQPGDMVFPSRK